VLGIETSCDETSAAVLVGEHRRPELAGLVILSQDVHKVFGGVVPELASRAHLAALPAVVDRALAEAGLAWSAVDAVAVTPGAAPPSSGSRPRAIPRDFRFPDRCGTRAMSSRSRA